MKKTLLAVLAIFCVFGLFCSCGGDDKDDPEKDNVPAWLVGEWEVFKDENCTEKFSIPNVDGEVNVTATANDVHIIGSTEALAAVVNIKLFNFEQGGAKIPTTVKESTDTKLDVEIGVSGQEPVLTCTITKTTAGCKVVCNLLSALAPNGLYAKKKSAS